ncbi:hypothetical protein CONCODRAFT_12600 [Conidiobolus coronatus NRRL 28638]|uniref:F-box domain-containing protein n=1 Tax=Conidiobolus coronatus (strain ATCC 28846 / CBS 209.66 / NRRL 28638) TaxID=796925 RepID=A0A137NSP7_CONC2|nr:hypothetical protein CONCODRAFT_12600 [Conidiobolus coronatus NRRL 28638]|eukprot:KXN65726.1 hypothetical protein CONCODRAFT_12600 [Conidiobolus coronatus NRRL 28638]
MACNQKQPDINRKNKEHSNINLNETTKDNKTDYYPKNSVERSEVWNINSLLSKIFSYCNFKDLIEYNIVCKNWNQITNPIIHQSIKLLRGEEILDSIYGCNLDNSSLILEIEECISNNEKHALSVKEFTLSNQIQSQKLVSFFEAFNYIENLTLYCVNMNQDLFLCIINPLTQLRDLKLDNFNVNYTSNKHNFPQAIQLPSSLTRIAISNVCIDNNPELFIQTINSHRTISHTISKFENF